MKRCSPLSSGANIAPTWARSKPAKKSKKPAAAPISPRASVMVLPCSATTSRARSSCRARMPSATAPRAAPRSTPLLRPQDRCAFRAASSAASTWEASPSGASATVDSSAGLITSRVPSVSIQEPPMSIAGSRFRTLLTSISPFGVSADSFAGQVNLDDYHHDLEGAARHLLRVLVEAAYLIDEGLEHAWDGHADERTANRPRLPRHSSSETNTLRGSRRVTPSQPRWFRGARTHPLLGRRGHYTLCLRAR